jgi:hypothetical protein
LNSQKLPTFIEKLNNMNRIVIFSVSAMCLLFAFTHEEKQNSFQPTDNQPFILLELFTSQGCSSCPSADKLVEKTLLDAQKSGKKVFALSYHVDYWDRLGWKDPYSQAQFTQRQYDYSKWMNSENVYTPQIVVNGTDEFVGSDSKKMTQTISKLSDGGSKINFQFENIYWKKEVVNLEINISDLPKNSQLNVALVNKNTETSIPRGENEGRKLTGVNVVRVLQKLPSTALKNKVNLLIPNDLEKSNTRIIAFLQDKNTHQILGVSQLEL